MEWVGKQAEIPPPGATTIAATIWLLEVDAFRGAEESLLVAGEYDASLPEHRVTLARLIANGEQVVFLARKNGLILTPAGFESDDLQATLNSLHTTFRGQYGPKSTPKTTEIIECLLNA